MAKNKFIATIDRISEIASKEKWEKAYDKKLDYFCWTNTKEAKSARLVKVSNEIFLYFNSKGLVKGIGIEYLKNNFIEHNPEYKDLTKLFTEKVDGGIFIIPKNEEKKSENKFVGFVEDIIKEIKIDSWENKQSPEELEKLVSIAIGG